MGARPMRVYRTSILTGVDHYRDIDVTNEELRKLALGADIKTMLPHLSVEDRQFLEDGTTPDEWMRHQICESCDT